jgi:multisubunit Na+/H+ antiporter MnhC subunit
MKFSIKTLIIPILLFTLFSVFLPFDIQFDIQTEPFLSGSASVAQTDLWDNQTGMDRVGEKFGEGGGEPEDIRNIIANMIKVVLTFLAIIFLILIIMAGFKWMTASGNEDKIKEAKAQLSHAIIGLTIVLAAFAITEFILEVLMETTKEGFSVPFMF